MKNCPWFTDKTILTFLFIIGWTAAPTTADQSYDYDEYNEYDDYGNGGMAEMDYISNLQTNTVFISKPINLWRNLGDSMRLPCIVDRLESYIVIWRKDGNIITVGSQVINQVDGRIKLEEERDGNYLVISSAEESDAGEYACEISTWNLIKLIHSVFIRVKPVIRLTPESGLLTVTEGDSATLACHAIAGIPSPMITWRKRDGLIPGPVNSFITGNMTHMQDIMGNMTHMQDMRMIPGNVISFDSVSRNQSGYYVCSATQPQPFGPPVTAELQLDVQQMCQGVRECFSSVDVVAPENVVQGEDAILECRFDLPEQHMYSFKWYKDEKEIYRYTLSDSPSIRIFNLPGVHVETLNPAISETTILLHNVDLSTSGSYKCEVSADAPIFITKDGVKNLNVVAPRKILQDDEKYAIAMNVSELIAKNLIQHDNETFDLYVDASKNFAKMIDTGVPEDLLKYLQNPEEYKIVTRQSAISSSSSASTSTTAPPPTTEVSPTIAIGEPVVGGYLGKFVMLECEVSAWPKPINYWEKDGRYLTSGARHQIKEVNAREIYKYRMILNVTLVSHDDVGTYYCVSKNKMGSSRGSIQVYKRGFLFGPNGGRIRAYPRYRVGIDFRVSMWIKPTNVTGLLLAVKGRRDCVILEMVNGEIIFSVDNGRGPMIAKFKPEYPDYLCNGEWHKVEAVKSKNVATVAVDNIFAAPAIGPPGVDSTDTNNPLFIGGHERPATLRLMRADSNFEGCIRDVSIENNDLIVTDDMLFGNITADVCPLY